jgi:FAD/FMN-containing dehydrogenase
VSQPTRRTQPLPASALPRGRAAHDAAVARLVGSYRAIPADAGVRLAKRTSNLFRPRVANDAPGLDVSGLDGVISIDPGARTADVQGMCTYEHLVGATLPFGLMPAVVPQLRTITLGGAVTGLGIESTSFRHGLPHESVLELDVLTGAGEVVTARPDGEHADLFGGFPNSYGTLGYATRLRIALEPVARYVLTRNVRFGSLAGLTAAIAQISEQAAWDGEEVTFLDGVVFSADESYLVLGRWSDVPASIPSDYTGQRIYYRSLAGQQRDTLTTPDYLWRWDTDWFWCSRAFGAQHPLVRRVWPRRYRRSDVYHRLVGLENRHQVYARLQRLRGRPDTERVVQDVEVPIEATERFLGWFLEHVPMRPLWVCPLRLTGLDGKPWPLYPVQPGRTYVNVGFWGGVPVGPGRSDGDTNREIEQAVTAAGGHKSLYSDAYYDEAEFWAHYGGEAYRPLKHRYDPDGRLLDLYAKAVRRR